MGTTYYRDEGPGDGPAPADGTVRRPTVELDVTAGDETHPARFQFWAPAGGGGIYVAWEVDAEWAETASGRCGQFLPHTIEGGWLDETDITDEATLWLGPAPFVSADGDPVHCVHLVDDAASHLAHDLFELLVWFQSPSIAPREFRWQPDERLAPRDAVAGRAFEITGVEFGNEVVGLFQPWRFPDSGAAYVAWEVGDATGMYGTLSAQCLFVGRSGQPYVGRDGFMAEYVSLIPDGICEAVRSEVRDLRADLDDRRFEADSTPRVDE